MHSNRALPRLANSRLEILHGIRHGQKEGRCSTSYGRASEGSAAPSGAIRPRLRQGPAVAPAGAAQRSATLRAAPPRDPRRLRCDAGGPERPKMAERIQVTESCRKVAAPPLPEVTPGEPGAGPRVSAESLALCSTPVLGAETRPKFNANVHHILATSLAQVRRIATKLGPPAGANCSAPPSGLELQTLTRRCPSKSPSWGQIWASAGQRLPRSAKPWPQLGRPRVQSRL